MEREKRNRITAILQKELTPALGCTEPATYAYVAAVARKYAPGTIERMEIEASAAMIKGVQYVTIPGSGGLRGGKLSAALGALWGDPDRELEILTGIGPQQVAAAQALVSGGAVTIERVPNPIHSLYLMVSLFTDQGSARAAVACTCTDLIYLEQNGRVLLDARAQAASGISEEDESLYQILDLPAIYEFASTATAEELEPIRRAIELNCAIAEDGMANPYGMQVGPTLRDQAGRGLISMDLCTVAMMWGAAGVDARMGGSNLPAMSNCGSGNQGIACTAPVCYAGAYLGRSPEEILRAATVANLINIFAARR